MSLKLNKPEKLGKRREAEEKTRQRGRLSFILYRGVLGWGGLMIVVTSSSDVLIDHKRLAIHLVRSLFLILAGSVMGLLWWDNAEGRFHRATKHQDMIDKTCSE